MTAVFVRDVSGWRLLHLHHSVGVPDESLGSVS
jgi:hypothetical protein